MAGYKEVLVAVDLSDDLIEVLKAAVEKVGSGANVSIVHVLEPAYYYYGMEPALGTLAAEFRRKHLEARDRSNSRRWGASTACRKSASISNAVTRRRRFCDWRRIKVST